MYNKANELQEDISMKRFDLRVAQIHLGAVRAQVSTLVNPFVIDGSLLEGSLLLTMGKSDDIEGYCGAEYQ